MAWSRAIGGSFLLVFLASWASPEPEVAAAGVIHRSDPVHDESGWVLRLGARPDSAPTECVAQTCAVGWVARRCGGEVGCFPPGFECCGDGTWCGAGERCADCGAGRSLCVPDGAVAQCCDDGSACAGGTRCGSCGAAAFC